MCSSSAFDPPAHSVTRSPGKDCTRGGKSSRHLYPPRNNLSKSFLQRLSFDRTSRRLMFARTRIKSWTIKIGGGAHGLRCGSHASTWHAFCRPPQLLWITMCVNALWLEKWLTPNDGEPVCLKIRHCALFAGPPIFCGVTEGSFSFPQFLAPCRVGPRTWRAKDRHSERIHEKHRTYTQFSKCSVERSPKMFCRARPVLLKF